MKTIVGIAWLELGSILFGLSMMHGLISIFDCETYIEVTQYEFVFDNPQYEFIVYISLNVTMDMTYIGVGSHG